MTIAKSEKTYYHKIKHFEVKCHQIIHSNISLISSLLLSGIGSSFRCPLIIYSQNYKFMISLQKALSLWRKIPKTFMLIIKREVLYNWFSFNSLSIINGVLKRYHRTTSKLIFNVMIKTVTLQVMLALSILISEEEKK